MREEIVTLHSDGAGAAVADTSEPVSGEIAQITGGAVMGGNLVVTRKEDNGAIYSGAFAGVVLPLPRPVANGPLHLVVAGGAFNATDVVRVFWEDE